MPHPSPLPVRPPAPRGRHAPAALAAALLLAAAACGDDPSAPNVGAQPAAIAGAWRATTFRILIPGQATPTDVLAAGGSLTVTIAADSTTTGALSVPASVAGGTPFNASMAGRLTRLADGTFRIEQPADTFVRDLEWTYDGTTLRVADQPAGSTRFTITLSRP